MKPRFARRVGAAIDVTGKPDWRQPPDRGQQQQQQCHLDGWLRDGWMLNVFVLELQGQTGVYGRSAGVHGGNDLHGNVAQQTGRHHLLVDGRHHVLDPVHHALPPGGPLPRLPNRRLFLSLSLSLFLYSYPNLNLNMDPDPDPDPDPDWNDFIVI